MSTISSFAQIAVFNRKQNLIKRLKRSQTVCSMSWVFVDNDGDPYKLNTKTLSRNIVPLSFKVDKNLYKNFSVTSIISFNRLKAFQEVNNGSLPYSRLFFSFDLNGRISIKDDHFDFYFLNGIGYSTIDANRLNAPKASNINFGAGFYIKIFRNAGINLESAAKFGLRKPIIKNNSNYFFHTLGLSLFL